MFVLETDSKYVFFLFTFDYLNLGSDNNISNHVKAGSRADKYCLQWIALDN